MSNKKYCTCDRPFSNCANAMEAPHGDKWYCSRNRLPEQYYKLIDGWIEEMNSAGLTPDQMIAVLRLAAAKFNNLKNKQNE